MTHKLFHGDSRKLLDIEQIDTEPGPFVWQDFPEGGIDCVVTDPPYGVAFKSTFNKNPETKAKYNRLIEDDHNVDSAIESFDLTLHAMLPHLAPTCEMYIFSQWTVAPEWQMYLRSLGPLGIELRQLIIWEKGYPGIGDVKYNWGGGHEFIYYLKKGSRPIPYRRSGILHVPTDPCGVCGGAGYVSKGYPGTTTVVDLVCGGCDGNGVERPPLPSVIEIDKVRPGTNIHPTEKPVSLLKILIEYSTVPGQFVFDPYAGSGSTLLAAKELGRHCAGIEKDAHYFKDAIDRLSELSLFG